MASATAVCPQTNIPYPFSNIYATPTSISGRPMGVGVLGDQGTTYKRKFRWTMTIKYCLGGTPQFVPEEMIRMGTRPLLDVEDTEINYLQGKAWLSGKGTWNTLTVTYYDVAGKSAGGGAGSGLNQALLLGGADGGFVSSTPLFSWLSTVYDITNPCTLKMGSRLNYEGQALIYLYDGCGYALEGWLLENVWPQSVNFGELNASSSDELTVEVTMRYAQVHYASYCPTGSVVPCECTPCVVTPVPPPSEDCIETETDECFALEDGSGNFLLE